MGDASGGAGGTLSPPLFELVVIVPPTLENCLREEIGKVGPLSKSVSRFFPTSSEDGIGVALLSIPTVFGRHSGLQNLNLQHRLRC